MMQYLTPKTSIKSINEAALRSSSAQAVAEIMFVKMAQEQQLDDTTVAEFPELFVQWDENWRGKAGDIVRDEGQLYHDNSRAIRYRSQHFQKHLRNIVHGIQSAEYHYGKKHHHYNAGSFTCADKRIS